MKKNLLLIASVCTFALVFGQQNATKWQAAIEPHKVFIENKGQFDALWEHAGGNILFGTDGQSSVIFFTKTGLTYSLEKRAPEKEDNEEQVIGGDEEKEALEAYREKQREEKEGNGISEGTALVQMEWVGANENVEVVAGDKVNNYFNYHLAGKAIDKAMAFQKITYKNLYANIDVVYTFHEGEGIEYSLILHPGADVSQVKMRYVNADKINISPTGDIHIATIFGDVIDRAPKTFVYNQTDNSVKHAPGKSIKSEFNLQGNEVSFNLGAYDNSLPVIIDPWTTTPTLPRSGRAFYVKTDSVGNAYVYGGDTPFTLEKYNSSGILQWSYNTGYDSSSNWFGCLIVDRAGNAYITDGTGGTLAKISPAGTEIWSKMNTTLGGVEYWTMDFNCDQSQLVIGGMSGLTGYIFNMNLTNGAVLNNKQVAKMYKDTEWIPIIHIPIAVSDPNEIRSLCFSPNGNFYFLTPDTLGSISPTFAFNYEKPSGWRWPYYLPYSEAGTGQGQNSIRATVDYIYTTDGEVLDKRDINTGAILDSANIPGGIYQMNSGLAIDTCGNVYVGSQKKVCKYDANLNFLSAATTLNAVYDVSIGANGDVLACGQGFATALAMSACPQVRAICDIRFSAAVTPTNLTCAGACNGTATATAINGTGPYRYLWSNSATTQTVNGLCAATYTVTITDQSNSTTVTATTTITQPAALTATIAPTAATCGSSNGAATATVTNGTGTITYVWSNGATTRSISGVAPNTYDVTATSAGGCSVSASAVVTSSGTINVSATETGTTCGSNNGQASVNVLNGTGTYTYVWSNGGTTNSITGVAAGTYTVTVSQSGCTATASELIATSTPLTLSAPSITSTSCGLNNGSVSITVTSGTSPYTYTWSNSYTTSSITNLSAGSYTVTVSATGCTATASAAIDTSSTLSLSGFGGRAGCTSTGSASVSVTEGTGPFTYLWSNGATAANLTALSAGNYSITVTGAGNCTASTTVTVTSSVNGVTLSSSATTSGCSDSTGSATATPTTGTSPFTYAWSNGATSGSIQNIPPGTYSVTVTGTGGCSATASVSVSATGALSVTTSSTNAACGATNGTAQVTNAGGPYTYSWSNGATTATITNLAAATYTVSVSEAGTCSGTASVVISPSGGSVAIQAQPTTICPGDTSQICAPSGFSTYHWNVGAATQCINVTQPGNYYLTVTGTGNCTATSNQVTIAVNAPDSVSITQHEDTLRATGALTYQWYFNGAPISGATSSMYVATQVGSYYAEGTGSNGCSGKSKTIVLKGITGIDAISDASDVRVYPNPLANGSWHLDVTNDWIGSDCEVYDAAGRLIFRTEIKGTQSEIELNITQGIYLMRINSAQKNYAIKLIKL